MNVPVKNILLNATLQQYWQLLRVMLFNLKTIGYVVTIFLSTGILGLVMLLIPVTSSLGMVLAILSFVIVLFVIGMGLPVGMVIVLSNRHISMVENLRNKLFFIGLSCGLLSSIIISSIVLNTKKEIPVMDFSLVVMFVYVIYFWVTAYVGSKNTSAAILAPLAAIFLVSFLSEFLIKLPIVYLLLINLVVWYLFYRWWVNFNPYGKPNNTKLPSLSQLNDPQILARSPFFISSKMRTPMGTLLLGYGDSYTGLLLRIGIIYSGACAFSFYMFGMLKTGFSQDLFIKAILVGVGYSLVIVGVDFFGARIINRLKRNWLFLAGSRESIFLHVERFFWRGWISLVLLNLMVVMMLLLLMHQYQYIILSTRVLIVLALLLVFNFYRDMFFYEKPTAIGEINVLKLITSIIPFVIFLYYLISKYEYPNIFDWKDVFAIAIIFGAACSFKFVRIKCIKKWKTIDL